MARRTHTHRRNAHGPSDSCIVGKPSVIQRIRGRRAAASRKKASDLAAQNRHFEAIALLSANNRTAMDAESEALLVRLRHQAFGQVVRSSSPTPWPPDLADPFPQVSGQPPEIERSDLTADLLGGALLRHGCLLVRKSRHRVAGRAAD